MIGSLPAATNPTYGTSIGNTLQLEWSSTSKLLFQGDISAVPVNDTTIVTVTHPTVTIPLAAQSAGVVALGDASRILLEDNQFHSYGVASNGDGLIKIKQSYVDELIDARSCFRCLHQSSSRCINCSR